MPSKFLQVLWKIGKAAETRNLNEAEVEKLVQEEGFFQVLHYQGIGIDILAQRTRSNKRYDVALLGLGGRVRAVIEFKQYAAGELLGFQVELFEKYVRPHLSRAGALFNGREIIVFLREDDSLKKALQFELSSATEDDASQLYELLKAQKVDFESLPNALALLDSNDRHPLRVEGIDSEAAQIFFQVFQLREGSAFGRLIASLKFALPTMIQSNSFTRGSYEFWEKTFARELDLEDVPNTWKAFLSSDSASEIKQFSFALETAYTIVSRLMLAKAADDCGFPDVQFTPIIRSSINELSVRGKIAPRHYLEVIKRSFERAGAHVFHSIFSQDIFDWWLELRELKADALFLSLAEAMFTLGQFDFSVLSGDLLGGLYQQHFDPETRKALGEFYTPSGAIEFILDECGYKGQRSRLLDPSCGSGSFIAAALRRYLATHASSKRVELLSDLTEGLRIVGFDINPFAVLMAQVNYAALILPAYAEALKEDPGYRILRLPVFRTDSLRIEDREEEISSGKNDKLTVTFLFEEEVLRVSVYLPLKDGKTKFAKLYIPVPRFEDAKAKGLLDNLEDYIAVMARVFQVVRNPRLTLYDVLLPRFGDRSGRLVTFLTTTVEKLFETVGVLKNEYNDGRFLKTIEDLVLAVSLKSDMKYDFVVGNPPYVRVQNIPSHVREYWTNKYDWVNKNFDIYVPFIERAVSARSHNAWLSEGGKLGFILSNRFENVDYAAELREHMPSTFKLNLLLDMRDTRVFSGAQNYPAIIVGECVRGDGRSGSALGARVFAADTAFLTIRREFPELAKRAKSHPVLRAEGFEVFTFEREHLKRDGWWIMPEHERRVFDKLRSVDGSKLTELTATASGGFAGYQTSADSIFVLDELEDHGDELLVLPRFAHSQARPRPIFVEKAGVRPFLFGKDVSRWLINFRSSWVIFPYDRYELNPGLLGAGVVKWELIPTRATFDKQHYAQPRSVRTIEERFPKLWKYLLSHQSELRRRESGKYGANKSLGENWYEATYPRGLEFYFEPKIVLQVLSSFPSFAIDEQGEYVFTAGGTAGVYGISLKNKTRSAVLRTAGFLNSAAADFCIKQISSVFGNKYYSYGDQFIAPLVVPIGILKSEQFQALVERQIEIARLSSAIESALVTGTDGLRPAMKEFDFKKVSQISSGKPTFANFNLEQPATVEQSFFGYETNCAGRSIGFETRAHAELLASLLNLIGKKSITASDVLEMPLPETELGARKMLELIEGEVRTQNELNCERSNLENALNEHVFDIASLTRSERKIVSDFLKRFSNAESVWEA